MLGNTFYLMLPSNDGSLKYFSDNKKKFFEKSIDKRIDLEGEWEVELSSISLPHDSVKCIVDIGSTFGSHFSTDKTSQFHVIANEKKKPLLCLRIRLRLLNDFPMFRQIPLVLGTP